MTTKTVSDDAGRDPISLGPRILRADTAAVSVWMAVAVAGDWARVAMRSL